MVLALRSPRQSEKKPSFYVPVNSVQSLSDKRKPSRHHKHSKGFLNAVTTAMSLAVTQEGETQPLEDSECQTDIQKQMTSEMKVQRRDLI